MRSGTKLACVLVVVPLVAAIALTTRPAHAQIGTAASTEPTATAQPDLPLVGLSEEVAAIREELDAATARAVKLEDEIETLDADRRAIDERLAVTAERITVQRAEVDAAQARLDEARAAFRLRLVEVYKRGSIDPLSVLFSSDTLTELLTRADVLGRIVEDDSQVVADLNIAAADARYQAAQLEEFLAQDRALRAEQETRRSSLAALLAEQESLIETLTAQERTALNRIRQLTASVRAQWKSGSIPVGTAISQARATVDSHPGVDYLVSSYMPRTYHSTGQTFSAVCSWYGPGFNGRTTASGQVFNQDDLTCASRTLPFGTVLALTRGSRRVIVYVNDRGPYIAGRDLDLSKAAASALGFSGVATVSAEIVSAVK